MHCGICNVKFNQNDYVYLDEYHTVTHYYCFKNKSVIIAVGSFKEIIDRFEFFKQLR